MKGDMVGHGRRCCRGLTQEMRVGLRDGVRMG